MSPSLALSSTAVDAGTHSTAVTDLNQWSQGARRPVSNDLGTQDVQLGGSTVAPLKLAAAGLAQDELLQLWKGVITDVHGDTIIAKLIDQTNPDCALEIAEFSVDEFTKDDRPLVQCGAVFYLSIRYEQLPGRPRQRVTRLRMRRLAGFSGRERRKALHLQRDMPWD